MQRTSPLKAMTVTGGFRTKARPTHDGIDYRAKIGTAVYAATDGRVQHHSNARAGTNIQITAPDGTITGYSHMSKRFVANGATVKMGDLIGETGDTGNVTGPHLHFYVIVRGEFVNPSTWLKSAPAAPKPVVRKTTSYWLSRERIRKMQSGLRKKYPAYRLWVNVKRGRNLVADGIDGPQTQAWVRQFQQRTGLHPDGVAGPTTIAKLAERGITL